MIQSIYVFDALYELCLFVLCVLIFMGIHLLACLFVLRCILSCFNVQKYGNPRFEFAKVWELSL